jgi:NAD(P)-dependent dehydrogenase (short-subunit alcohol dehydrogenase family)
VSALTGQRVWVTGASSGIGAAVAAELICRGAKVAITARRREALDEVAAGRMRVEPADVTDAAALERIAASLADDWGGIDLIVLNAGIYKPVTPETFDPAIFREHFDVNVLGTVNAIAAVLPGMRARRAGRIAVTTSVTGYAGLPLAAAYGSTKAYLNSMCDSLRADLASSGVRVSVVAPGFVRTPLTDQNPFAMPGIIEADEAARIICDGLAAGDDEIGVPRKALIFMKALAMLPGPIRRRYVARIARKREKD